MLLHKLLILFLTSNFFIVWANEPLKLQINPEHYEKMNLLIGVINPNDSLKKIAQKMKADFEFGGQFNVVIKEFDKLNTKDEILQYEKSGFPLIVFINHILSNKDNKKIGIEWRIYETSSAGMLKGKKVFQEGEINQSVAHMFADQILFELTGHDGFFSSMIVACKKSSMKKNKYHMYIYALHPVEYLNNLSDAKVIVDEPTICLAPRWHSNKPLLYYSKHTSYNLRLMCMDLNKRKSIVSNFDGLNLTPAFCVDGKIVLSITKDGKGRICQYIFDEKKKKGSFVSLTDKKIHAVSPSFIDEDHIAICAIDKSNKPRIAITNIVNGKVEYLTQSKEHCVCPSYCKKNNKIAYCKKVRGFTQVFVYDMNEKDHKQLTFNTGDKDSCNWSPCGNYIVFSVEDDKKSRIGIFNVLDQSFKYLTPVNEFWTNPSWSPIYNEIPFY